MWKRIDPHVRPVETVENYAQRPQNFSADIHIQFEVLLLYSPILTRFVGDFHTPYYYYY